MGRERVLVFIDIDDIGLNAIGALPQGGIALVPRVPLAFLASLPARAGVFHAARLGVQRRIGREHLRVLVLVFVRHADGVDVAFRRKIAGGLIHADMVGRRGACRVAHGRRGIQRNNVLLPVEIGFGGVRFAVAFLVGEIGGL